MNLEESVSIFKSKISVTEATCRYGKGKVSLEANGDVNAIEIMYLGWLKGVANEMPNKTYCLRTDKTILFTKRTLMENFPETLFLYYGNFRIRHVKVYNHDGSYVVATLKHETKKDMWSEGEGGDWSDTDTSNWDEKVMRDGKLRQFIDNRIPKRKSSKLIIANQYTAGGEYFLGNGGSYVGYYNRSDNNVVRTNQYAYGEKIKHINNYERDSVGSEILYVKRTDRLGLFSTTRESTAGWIRTTNPINIQSSKFLKQNKKNIGIAKFSSAGYAEKVESDIQGHYGNQPLSLPDSGGGAETLGGGGK